MIGPSQVTSKKVLIAIAAGEVEKDLVDGVKECRRVWWELRRVLERRWGIVGGVK